MLKPGDKIDRYTLESVIGEGGMGSVFRAHDERLDRHVAMKVVRAEGASDTAADAIPRLIREARAAAKLDHPNAISIFDVGEVEGTAFIAMELVSGNTLRAAIGDPAIPLEKRLRWLCDVGRALSAAHRAGLVHRDVKPENVMVRTDGMVKVLDFGIARRAATPVDPSAPTAQGTLLTLTAAGAAVGTPMYMAPEQIRGDPVDGRTDQFAWGVVAYELLTGSVPWRPKNEALALAAAILTQPAGSITTAHPEVPAEVERIVIRALAKEPADRFASMDDLLLALDPYASPGAGSIPPASRAAERSSSRPQAAPSSPPLHTAEMRGYSAETMRAIMHRALERQERYGSEEIIQAAREIGVDEATIRAAAKDLERGRTELEELQAERKSNRVKLFRHAGIWAVVNLFCYFMIGWGATRWMLFGWGIGVAIQAVKYLFPEDARERRDRLAKKAKKAAKGQPPTPVPDDEQVREGLAMLLSTTSALRGKQRVEVPAPRVRVGAGSDREAEEAGEAEAEELAARRKAARG